MATYAELFDLKSDATLRNRVAVAATVKSHSLLSGTPTPDEANWASNTLRDPIARASLLLAYVLAANKSATVAQIQGATDNAIQANVDTAADAMIAGGVI